jgi:NAD(P)-dependent dehydrogenase (short-subunit alcohol dehydrogenase family)
MTGCGQHGTEGGLPGQDLTNGSVLVTGGASGLGLGTVKTLVGDPACPWVRRHRSRRRSAISASESDVPDSAAHARTGRPARELRPVPRTPQRP